MQGIAFSSKLSKSFGYTNVSLVSMTGAVKVNLIGSYAVFILCDSLCKWMWAYTTSSFESGVFQENLFFTLGKVLAKQTCHLKNFSKIFLSIME